MRTLTAAAILVALNTTHAQAQDPRIEPLSAAPQELQKAIARSESIAASMFRQDHAAAIAHDELATHVERGRDERPRGWITNDHEGGVTVLFVVERDGDYLALYKVETRAGRIAPDGYAKLDPPMPLSESQRAQLRARQLASSAGVARCSPAFNTIALPADDRDDGSWHVYLIAATSVSHLLVFGGHHRFTISRDGQTIQDQRAFTKGCIEMQTLPGSVAVISHLLDANPTEIHVFLNLLNRHPIGVLTQANRIMWFLKEGRVTGFHQMSGQSGEPRGSSSAEKFDSGLKEARANQATSEWQAYRGSFLEKFSPVLQQTMQGCFPESQRESVDRFTILFAVQGDGSLANLMARPEVAETACVIRGIRGVRVPAPPRPDWWEFIHMIVKRDGAPGRN